MKLNIEPFVGAGPVKLGMSREEVRMAMGGAISFKRLKTDDMPSDAFDEGIFVYYRPPGVCEAIEVSEPAEPYLLGQRVLGVAFSKMRHWLEQMEHDLEVEDNGLVSRKFGISLYAPDVAEEPDELVQSVLVFEAGYYERERKTSGA